MTGLILAGGRSLRMGRPKVFLEFKGKTFVENLVDLVSPLVDEVCLAVQDKNKFNLKMENVKMIEDKIKGQGPLVGIWSGLSQIKNNSALVLSCDMPLVGRETLEILFRADAEEWEVVCFSDSAGRPQPFPGTYKKTGLEKMFLLIKNGQFSMKDFLKAAAVNVIPAPESISTDFFNVNTPEDYESLIVSS